MTAAASISAMLARARVYWPLVLCTRILIMRWLLM